MKGPKQHRKQKYGLFSLICLVVGSIIGVEAYFKIGKLINLTKGNLFSIISTWTIAIIMIFATSIILISMLSSKKHEYHNGGIIHIIDVHTNSYIAKFVNLMLISLYTPLIIIIESVVAIKFLFVDFFNINNNVIVFLGPLLLIICFIWLNSRSIKFGRIFQYGSLLIKLLPLIFLILIALSIK